MINFEALNPAPGEVLAALKRCLSFGVSGKAIAIGNPEAVAKILADDGIDHAICKTLDDLKYPPNAPVLVMERSLFTEGFKRGYSTIEYRAGVFNLEGDRDGNCTN